MTDTAVPVQAVVVTPAAASVEAPTKKSKFADIARSAGFRAARTFSQAFLGTVLAGTTFHFGIEPLKSAGVAGFAAVLTLVQRWLDTTPVPTIPAG